MWPVEETVSLHSAALSVLMDAVRVDAMEFLRASPVALKTVHIVAIGLRGLLRKSLNQVLSEVEDAALGNVTIDELSKGESAVTAMLGKVPGSKPGPGRLEEERNLKFDMTWEKFKEEKEKRRAQERSTELGHLRSELDGDQDLDDDEDEDEDLDWISKVGGEHASGAY